ncbi:hypothetical protein BGZ46_010260 [Entomortierella lignicola]|nr:hypothetical protein BGZ46_010260 [Entomortierella lignicola]
MVAPAVIPVLASIGGALLSLLSPLTGSSKKKDADILHARQKLLQFTSELIEIVRLTNPDSPMLPEMKELEEAIALLEVVINNKGRTWFKKMRKPRVRFQEIEDRIAAIRTRLIAFSAEVARQAARQPAREPNRQPPIMIAMINSAGAIHPMYLEQLDNLLIHFFKHFYDDPRASLVINHAPQPAIAQIYEVDNTPEIVMEAENVEPQPVQPADLPIPGYENLDQIAVQNHRAMLTVYNALHPSTSSKILDHTLTNTNPHPKIVILSGELCTSTDPKSKCKILGELSFKNRRDYVAHHHDHYTLRDNFTSYFQDVVSQGFIPAWAKTQILVEELEKNEHAWIFWIDTDAFITNMDIQLEQFVDDSYSLLITKDLNFMNAGVFMLKVNDWSRSYMRDVLSRMENGSNEQDWMIKLLEDPKYEEQRQVKYLPQCSFNSYWKARKLYEMYRPGDFVIHWAGHNFDIQSFNDWRFSRSIKVPFL